MLGRYCGEELLEVSCLPQVLHRLLYIVSPEYYATIDAYKMLLTFAIESTVVFCSKHLWTTIEHS